MNCTLVRDWRYSFIEGTEEGCAGGFQFSCNFRLMCVLAVIQSGCGRVDKIQPILGEGLIALRTIPKLTIVAVI